MTRTIRATAPIWLAALVIASFAIASPASAQEGPFDPEPGGPGAHLAVFDGGEINDAIAAAPDAISFWITVDGEYEGHIVGAPEFVNATFTAVYPDEIPSGTVMIVIIGG